MTAIESWTVPWLLEPHIKAGRRVILVADVTDEQLKGTSYEPPTVAGQTCTRLGPGVFGYKTGATLQVWPPDRSVRDLPNVAKPFYVVLDPAIFTLAISKLGMTIGYVARWGLNEVSTQEMGLRITALAGIAGTQTAVGSVTKFSIDVIRDVKVGANFTMPYVCGLAAGNLLLSKVGKWLASPAPATVTLRDALGRANTMDDVMPTDTIHAMGKKFVLCPEVKDEIRFIERHG